MKFSTLFLAATLTLTAALSSVKKAEACLFFSTPLAMVVGLAVGMGTTIPFITSYDNIKDGAYDRAFNLIWLSIYAISVLDQDMDKLDGALINKFPTIPVYVISEAVMIMKEKSNLVKFNDSGYKSVTMSEEEFSNLEPELQGADPSEVAAFKLLLTTPEMM